MAAALPFFPESAKFKHSVEFAPISSLSFSHDGNLLLAGIGPNIEVYSVFDGTRLAIVPIFPAGRVHGIRILQDAQCRMIIYGRKRCAVVSLVESAPFLQVETLITSEDWIWDAVLFPASAALNSVANLNPDVHGAEILAVGTAHNVVEIWSPKLLSRIAVFKCDERCMLYSLSFFSTGQRLFVASGTVFNQVVIWEPLVDTKPVSYLIGHDGVIWNVRWSADGSRLISVSDDRSARVWKTAAIISSTKNTATDLSKLHSYLELFGHGARVWDALFATLGDNLDVIFTASEDKTCAVWDATTGERITSLEGHKGGVWKITISPSNDVLCSGAGDCSIRLWNTPSLRAARIETPAEIDQSLSKFALPSSIFVPSKASADFIRFMTYSASNSDQRTLYMTSNLGIIYRLQCSTDNWQTIYQTTQGNAFQSILPLKDRTGQEIALCGDQRGSLSLLSISPQGSGTEVYKWQVAKRKVAAMWPAPTLHLLAESVVVSVFVALADGPLQWWALTKSANNVFAPHLLCEYIPPSPGSMTEQSSADEKHLEESSDSESNESSSEDDDAADVAKPAKKTVASKKAKPAKSSGQDRSPTIWSIYFDVTEQRIVCGDSNGCIHLFEWNPSAAVGAASSSSFTALHSLKYVHSHERVSSICMFDTNDGLISGGRDGHFATMRYIRDSTSGQIVRLSKVSSAKVHRNMEFVEKISIQTVGGKKSALAFGFYGSRAMLFDITEQRVVWSINCGGSKRPFDACFSNSTSEFAGFAFQKDSLVYEFTPKDAPLLFKKPTLHAPYHWREVNSLQFIDSETSGQMYPFVTTSEDTTVCVGLLGDDARVDIAQNILSHDSATRTSATIVDKNQVLLFVGGGRLQLRCFRSIEPAGSAPSFALFASGDPPRKRSRPKKAKDEYDECRIMGVAAHRLAESKALVVAGRSDAAADVWILDEVTQRFAFVTALKHTHAILNVRVVMVRDHTVVVSSCTNGTINFWDLTSVLVNNVVTCNDVVISQSAPSPVTLHAESPSVAPLYTTRPHQAGVNALDIAVLQENDDVILNVVSSGDDQDLWSVKYAVAVADSKLLVLEEVSSICQRNINNSCVTGLRSLENLIITVSGDQRLNVWDQRDLSLVGSTMLSISDVSDVDVRLRERNGERTFFCLVSGQGLEIVQFPG